MAATADGVKAVLLRDYDAERAPSLAPFLAAASSLVARAAVCATARGFTVSAETWAGVEVWVAAHLYCQSDATYQSKSTDGASGSYRGQTGMYLESTLYGQTAVLMDPSGCLASAAKGGRASAGGSWLGKGEREQRTYAERN